MIEDEKKPETPILRPDCPYKRKKCLRFGNCEACRTHHADSGRPRPCENDRKNRRQR